MFEADQHYRLIFGIILGVIILGVAGVVLFMRNGTYITQTVERGELTRTITVTGEVVPTDEVTLGFTNGGRVQGVFVSEGQTVKKGDQLVALDQGALRAELRQAVADKELAEAERSSLLGADRTQGKIQSVQQEAYTVFDEAFRTADAQIKTQIDELFSEPQSTRPEVTLAINDYFKQQAINKGRRELRSTLTEWETWIRSLSVESITAADADTTYAYLDKVSVFLTLLADGLSGAEANSAVSEARLTEFRAIVKNARATIDAAITDVVTVRESLRAALADVPVQDARVASAQASIDRYQSLLDDFVLVAPFTGTVTGVDVTSGEIVSANQQLVSIVGEGELEIEVYIPEVKIADVDVGDPARVVFDAYGDDLVLQAMVSYVDVRATERNGIPTYKTLLAITDVPPAVRAGMTATLDITTLVIDDVLTIPRSAVTVQDQEAAVEVLVDGVKETRVVETGRTDTVGNVEILSGVTVGDVIIISEKQ